MDSSQEQFQALLAHLVARANRALAAGAVAPPLSLLLRTDGQIEVGVGVANTSIELEGVLAAMQESLTARVAAGDVLAVAFAYTESSLTSITALMENRENYCVRLSLPVSAAPAASVNVSGIEVADGSIYVFPILGDS